jgi:hypothetical protein
MNPAAGMGPAFDAKKEFEKERNAMGAVSENLVVECGAHW